MLDPCFNAGLAVFKLVESSWICVLLNLHDRVWISCQDNAIESTNDKTWNKQCKQLLRLFPRENEESFIFSGSHIVLLLQIHRYFVVLNWPMVFFLSRPGIENYQGLMEKWEVTVMSPVVVFRLRNIGQFNKNSFLGARSCHRLS